jgi:protein-disulfide isomerase
MQGRFWDVHDLLYSHQEELSDILFTEIAMDPHNHLKQLNTIAKAEAEKNIIQDLDDGDMLAIESTPAFFLCGPDGRVLRLGALSQVTELIR